MHFDEQKDKHQYDDENVTDDEYHIRRKGKQHTAHHNADIELFAECALQIVKKTFVRIETQIEFVRKKFIDRKKFRFVFRILREDRTKACEYEGAENRDGDDE